MRWLALAVLVTSCATAAPVVPAGQRAVPSVCLPEGFPPMEAWETVAIAPRMIGTDRSGAAIVVQGTYMIGGRQMHVVLTPLGPASIDPAPDDAAVPLWINPALTTDDLLLRAEPGAAAPCVWRSAAPILERVPEPEGTKI